MRAIFLSTSSASSRLILPAAISPHGPPLRLIPQPARLHTTPPPSAASRQCDGRRLRASHLPYLARRRRGRPPPPHTCPSLSHPHSDARHFDISSLHIQSAPVCYVLAAAARLAVCSSGTPRRLQQRLHTHASFSPSLRHLDTSTPRHLGTSTSRHLHPQRLHTLYCASRKSAALRLASERSSASRRPRAHPSRPHSDSSSSPALRLRLFDSTFLDSSSLRLLDSTFFDSCAHGVRLRWLRVRMQAGLM
jgi:hypothetical protein